MYKNVFSARNEDTVSYGTAEDKIGYKGKAISAGIAMAGSFGLGYFLFTTDLDANGSPDWYEFWCPNDVQSNPWSVLLKICTDRYRAEKWNDLFSGLK